MSSDHTESETNGTRTSSDSDRLSEDSPIKELNGGAHSEDSEDLSDMDPTQRLQLELERTKEEKEALATQYRNLLAKLTTMRTTLGNKLKQDAVRSSRHSAIQNTPHDSRSDIGRTRPSGTASAPTDGAE